MQTEFNALLSKFCDQLECHWETALSELNISALGQLADGNRLRPQMCFLGYLAAIEPTLWEKDDLSVISDVAVSIELLHKASLIIDDWIDHDGERRGQPTLHTVIGPERSVLLAIKMVALSMQRLKDRYPPSVILPQHYYMCLDTLIETTYSLAAGAYQELSIDSDSVFDDEVVKEISRLETSVIIGNSLLLGYYAGAKEHKNPKIESEFKWIGDQCGYIFQAMNDLEAFRNPDKLLLHKGRFNIDLSANRKNLAIALLYQVAGSRDRAALVNADREKLMRLMEKYRIFECFARDIELEYAALVRRVSILQNEGIPLEWCNQFQSFLGLVRKFAEERL